MLQHINGRSIATQTEDELADILAEEYARLTPAEQQAVDAIIEETLAGGSDFEDRAGQSLYDVVGASHFRERPVDLETFIYDDEYLGVVCGNTWPVLFHDLQEIFDGEYSDIVISGGIGTGKTYACSVGICYQIYEVACMRDPHKVFNLTPDTVIGFAAFATSKKQAQDVALKHIVGKISSSSWFQRNFRPKPTEERVRFYYANGDRAAVEVKALATSDTSALGLAVHSAMMDESDFMPRKTKANSSAATAGSGNLSEAIYTQLRRRIESRFGRLGKIWLPCSKSTFNSFIQSVIKNARQDPKIFVRDYAKWHVRPDEYDDEMFWVLCGAEDVDARIIRRESEAERVKQQIPERAQVIEVPIDFLSSFESDLEGAIRDHAGVATSALSPFIQRKQKIQAMVDPSRRHPFTVLEYTPGDAGDFRWSEMIETVERHDRYSKESVFVSQPILNPGAPRAIHIDGSTKHCATSFVMAHIAGERQVTRNGYEDFAPVVIVDFVLRILPPVEGEIEFAMLRQMIYTLLDAGYPIRRVTLDQYQSVDTLQQLRHKGIEAERIPTNWAVYNTAKKAMYEGRIFSYEYEPLIRELRGLEADWEKHKVMKPESLDGRSGSKDCSDAFASVVYSLVTDPMRDALPPFKVDRMDTGHRFGDEFDDNPDVSRPEWWESAPEPPRQYPTVHGAPGPAVAPGRPVNYGRLDSPYGPSRPTVGPTSTLRQGPRDREYGDYNGGRDRNAPALPPIFRG